MQLPQTCCKTSTNCAASVRWQSDALRLLRCDYIVTTIYVSSHGTSASASQTSRRTAWTLLTVRQSVTSATTFRTSFLSARQNGMKRATTLRKPGNFAADIKDADNPPWSDEMLGPAVAKRGRGPQRAATKVSTTIRLDADVLAYFRALGPGYQSRINTELRRIVTRDSKSRPGRRTKPSVVS